MPNCKSAPTSITPADETRFDAAPAGQREKHQASEKDPGKHGEGAVDLAGEVLADQVEGERPEDGDEQ